MTKTKCSRDGNKAHSLESLLLLASHSNPSRKSLKNEERGVRALSWVRFEFSSSKWQERGLKGYGGGIYSLQPKNSRWTKGYPETPGIYPETPGNPRFSDREQLPDTPGNGVRSIRPYTRSIRVRQGKTSIFALLSCFVTHKCLYRFSLSTRFKSKPLNQVPLDSTAFLYSNFKFKI